MKDKNTIASFLIYVGSALCFFLPFATVSCGGMHILTLSGEQLAVGTTIKQAQPFGPPHVQTIHAEPLATIALLCAVVGIVLSLVGRKLAAGGAISGGAGAVSLLILQSRMHEKIQEQSGGIATVQMKAGFIVVLSLLIVGAIWNVFIILQGETADEPAIPKSEGADQVASPSEGSPSG